MFSKCKICRKYRQISFYNKRSLNANKIRALIPRIWQASVFEFQMNLIENLSLESSTFRGNINAEICALKTTLSR